MIQKIRIWLALIRGFFVDVHYIAEYLPELMREIEKSRSEANQPLVTGNFPVTTSLQASPDGAGGTKYQLIIDFIDANTDILEISNRKAAQRIAEEEGTQISHVYYGKVKEQYKEQYLN